MHPNVSADAFPSGAIVGCVAPTLGLLRHTRRKPSRGCREHAPGGETGRGVQLAGAVEPLVVAVVRAVGLGLGAESVVPAIALAAAQVSGLHGVIFGDGPQHDAVIAALERPEIVRAPGFVDAGKLRAAVRGACCMVLPSRREGYGIIVLEAAVYGTPSIVVREPDNAALELIEDGVNGIISASADPADLAAAIVRIHAAGEALRESTREWFRRNARRLSLDSSLATVLTTYESAIAHR